MAETTTTQPEATQQGAGAKEGRRRPRGAGRRNQDRPSRRSRAGGGERRARQEFDHELLDVRRVARVVAGGRRFSFSVAVVLGDRKGRVGVGTGKGQDTAAAMEKAIRDAKKNLITVPRTPEGSIPHEVSAKFKAAHLIARPAPGRGLVAGSAARVVLDLAGLTDVSAKLHSRTKNKLVIARATVAALRKLVAPEAASQQGRKAGAANKASAA